MFAFAVALSRSARVRVVGQLLFEVIRLKTPGLLRADDVVPAAAHRKPGKGRPRIDRVLEETGLAGDTIIVFLSDHGYQLGAHGLWQKKDLFENSVRTPVILAAPGRLEAGTQSDTLVELGRRTRGTGTHLVAIPVGPRPELEHFSQLLADTRDTHSTIASSIPGAPSNITLPTGSERM